jgi:hypothetical protein
MQDELPASNTFPSVQEMHFLLKLSQFSPEEQPTHVLLKVRWGLVYGHTHRRNSKLNSKLLGQDVHFCVLQFQNLGAGQETQLPSAAR